MSSEYIHGAQIHRHRGLPDHRRHPFPESQHRRHRGLLDHRRHLFLGFQHRRLLHHLCHHLQSPVMMIMATMKNLRATSVCRFPQQKLLFTESTAMLKSRDTKLALLLIPLVEHPRRLDCKLGSLVKIRNALKPWLPAL